MNTVKYLALFVCITGMLFSFTTESIKYEDSSNPDLQDFAMKTKEVQLENGILSFSNQAIYDSVIKSLISLSESDTYGTELLKEWGFSLEDTTRNPKEPFKPVLKKFEDRFRFRSMRSVNEKRLKDFLLKGGDPEKYEEDAINSSYLQATLSPDGVVKIGNVIYQVREDGKIAVITDGDWEKLNAVKLGEIGPNSTENVFFYDPANPEHVLNWPHPPEGGKGGPRTPPCQAEFRAENYPNAVWQFFSTSYFLPSDPVTYTWALNGHVFHTGVGAAGATTPQVQLNGIFGASSTFYTIELTITSTGTIPCSSTDSMSVGDQCYAVFEVTENLMNTNDFYFDVTTSLGSNLKYDWRFGDVTSLNSTAHVHHIYPYLGGSQTYTVELTVRNDFCSFKTSKDITTGCGEWIGNQVDWLEYSPGRKAKIRLFVDNNIFYHGFGAETHAYFRDWLGIWWFENVNRIEVGLEGTAYPARLNSQNGCMKESYPKSMLVRTNWHTAARDYWYNRSVYLRPNSMKSHHKLINGGTTFGPRTIDFQ